MKVLVSWRAPTATIEPVDAWRARLAEPMVLGAFAVAAGITAMNGEGWCLFVSWRPGGVCRIRPTPRAHLVTVLRERCDPRVFRGAERAWVAETTAAIEALETEQSTDVLVFVLSEHGFFLGVVNDDTITGPASAEHDSLRWS